MKIIAVTRTKNESKNVVRWIKSYNRWVDEVLIVDGGSEDNTVKLANAQKKTQVKEFTERIALPNGDFYNPQGAQINACYDWARELGADWVIFDDCDCFPNADIMTQGRAIFQTAERGSKLAVFAHRLFIEGDNYYPQMNEPGQSLWGFRADTDVHASEEDPRYQHIIDIPPVDRRFNLNPPLVLLHEALPTPEAFARKSKYYQALRGENKYNHPSTWAGEAVPLPEYATQ